MSNRKVEIRSRIMRSVRSTNTGPERRVREILSGMGYRYRLHCPSLPGKPDVSISSIRKVIFVHGCFWHQHPRCSKGRRPKSNLRYWSPKLRRNVKRDRNSVRLLKRMGWDVLIVWQCELKKSDRLHAKLQKFLNRKALSKRRAANSASA